MSSSGLRPNLKPESWLEGSTTGSLEAENARTLDVLRREVVSSPRDSREVAQPAFWPGSVRGCSQVSIVHRISLVIVRDAGANIVMMSERCSVENGMESAMSRGRRAGMEVVGGIVGVTKDPGLNMSWKKKTSASFLFL